MKKIFSVALLLGAATMANAAITVSLAGTTPVGSEFKYDYELSLTSDDSIRSPNDFFVVTDFAGYVNGSALFPTGWSFSYDLSGPIPSCCGTPGVDSAAVGNLVFKYNTGGPALNAPPNAANTIISGFSARSIFGLTAEAGFAVDNTKNRNNSNQGSGGFVDVPVGVPEPATMGLMGGALLGLGLLARRRK